MDIQRIRYFFPVFLIACYLYMYYGFPYRYSRNKKLIFPFKTNINIVILVILLIIFETLFIFYLGNYFPLPSTVPKFWWLVIPLITLIFVHLIYSITEPADNKDEKFIARPRGMLTKNGRRSLLIVMTTILLISISIEIYLSLKGKIDKHNLINSIFSNIFNGPKKMKYYVYSWLRFINLAIIIYLLAINEKYMCYLNLPFNWND